MKAMKAYFVINPSTYANDNAKIITMLNTMRKRWGSYFAETWYDKLADSKVQMANKTFDKVAAAFSSTFYPYNHAKTARDELNFL